MSKETFNWGWLIVQRFRGSLSSWWKPWWRAVDMELEKELGVLHTDWQAAGRE